MKKMSSLLVLTTLLVFGVSALADFKDFSQQTFKKAQMTGETVVVDFHAKWCSTCKKQEPVLNEIVNMPGYEKVVALKADYDEEKDLKKSLGVTKQSTVVVFKGGKEVARSTGVTSKAELKALIDMGL